MKIDNSLRGSALFVNKIKERLGREKSLFAPLALLIILFSMIHAPIMKKYIYLGTDRSDQRFLEHKFGHRGDNKAYLDSALSLLEFDIEAKFNDKVSIIHRVRNQKRIISFDMPWYAKYALVFYPYHTFRLGYSLTAALLTVFFPQEIFQFHFPRLIFVNILLMIFSLIIIFLILKKLTKNTAVAFIACLFFILDVSNVHNSYAYQAHTMSAVFYLLLPLYLFIISKIITPLKLGVICLLLALSISIVSSAYLVLLAILMGLSIYVSSCYRKDAARILHYSLAVMIGSLIVPAYLLGAEWFFKFKSLGIPSVMEPFRSWFAGDITILQTVPVHLRFMWDLRLFDIFIVPQTLIILFIVVYEKYRLKQFRNPLSNIRGLYDSAKEYVLKNKGYMILYFAIIIITLATAFYTNLPMSRNMTPYTLLGGILLGVFLGKIFVKGGKLVKGLVAVIILLSLLNFYLRLNIIRIPDFPSNNIFFIDESNVRYNNDIEFSKDRKSVV
jgi:hypothetical protein